MHAAVMPLARASDVFVATAAVADWRPAQMNEHKIKKDGKKVAPIFELTENEDILADVARLSTAPYCVGFAAESENLLKHARDKLRAQERAADRRQPRPGHLRPRRQRAGAGRRRTASASCRRPTSSRWRASSSQRSRRRIAA